MAIVPPSVRVTTTVAERGQVSGSNQKLDPKLSAAIFSGSLRSAGEGSLSEVVQVGSRYSVAYVQDLKKAGLRPLSEVRSQIETQVLGSKQAEAAANFMEKHVSALKPVDNLKTVLEEQAKRVAAAEKAAGTATPNTPSATPGTSSGTPATPEPATK